MATYLPDMTPAEQLQRSRDRCDHLRTEIKRGKEYLAQVEAELEETRGLLEDWPVFEHHCGRNPLAQLTTSLMINERIAEFLKGWLKRRDAQLSAANKQAEAAAKMSRHVPEAREGSKSRLAASRA